MLSSGSFAGASSGFFDAETQAPEYGGQPEKQREIGDVVDQAVRQHLRALVGARGEEGDEDQVSEPGAVWHDQGAERGALEPVLEQRFQSPDHQQRCGQKQREVNPHAGQAEGVDDVRERVHARVASSR